MNIFKAWKKNKQEQLEHYEYVEEILNSIDTHLYLIRDLMVIKHREGKK